MGILYTTTTPILLAVQANLVALGVLPSSQILVVGTDDEPKIVADKIIQLWPQDLVDNKALTHGAGRNGTHIEEPFWCQICTNLQTDEVDRNLQGFTDPKLGNYALRTKVLDAMHLFWPTDAAGNALTVCPIHLGNGRKGVKPRTPRGGGWTTSNIVFEITYRQAFNLARQ